MLVLGIILVCIGIALAYVFNYHHNIKHTNQYGVVEVDGLGGYMKRLLTTAGIKILLLTITLSGFGLIGWSFVG